ncbi:hypothetical protein M422DRAFT_35745 [Sphaerobolus stellatus SS14]|uniref:Uncharacterized protein n=1 Tax=Sphaerobolus stellatus (strain SS14) TaxID=990650 RepID=A0A0C9UTX7_SPHS4|nr:hypothetical protein M422DRAFT_35745 [Sphaerobolus stellatus SS14]
MELLEEYVNTVVQLKCLTHLSGLFTSQSFNFKEIQDNHFLSHLAKSPSLEYTQVLNPEGAEQWLRILRGNDGNCRGFEWQQEDPSENTYYWGDFFQGFIRS